MKKEDIVFLRFDVEVNGKKFKANSAAVIVEVSEKFSSNFITIFLEGSLIKVSKSYVKSMKVE